MIQKISYEENYSATLKTSIYPSEKVKFNVSDGIHSLQGNPKLKIEAKNGLVIKKIV